MNVIGNGNQVVSDSTNVTLTAAGPGGRTPSVGRIVHYVSYGTPGGEYTSQCRAGIVTEVCPESFDDDPDEIDCVSLAVLNPTGAFFNCHVGYDDGADGPRGGTWHWPEHV